MCKSFVFKSDIGNRLKLYFNNSWLFLTSENFLYHFFYSIKFPDVRIFKLWFIFSHKTPYIFMVFTIQISRSLLTVFCIWLIGENDTRTKTQVPRYQIRITSHESSDCESCFIIHHFRLIITFVRSSSCQSWCFL